MDREDVRRKISNSSQTPAGTANSIQGVTVKGYSHGDAGGHLTVTYVTS